MSDRIWTYPRGEWDWSACPGRFIFFGSDEQFRRTVVLRIPLRRTNAVVLALWRYRCNDPECECNIENGDPWLHSPGSDTFPPQES